MPAVPEFWAVGPSVCIARWGLPISSKARAKVPTMLVVPIPWAETDKELAWQLQEQEVAVEEAWLGRDTTTL